MSMQGSGGEIKQITYLSLELIIVHYTVKYPTRTEGTPQDQLFKRLHLFTFIVYSGLGKISILYRIICD